MRNSSSTDSFFLSLSQGTYLVRVVVDDLQIDLNNLKRGK